jgi:hypothetical protein
MQKSFTFIDVLVGISLMLIIFLGIFAAYQLSLKVIAQSKARIGATAIANQKIEIIRNLPYKEIGTTPASVDEATGDLPQIESLSQNNIQYTVETRIKYISDCFDGPQSSECPEAPEIDDCVKDYKRAKVKVSWDTPFKGEVSLTTDIAPKTLNQEVEECTGQAAGVLSVSVFNASGQAVSFPLIEIIDPETSNTLTTSQPSTGKYNFVLVPDTYKVKVTKSSYSSEETYQAGDIYNGKTIAAPVKSHPAVYEGRLTETGFSIDELGSMRVETRGAKGQGYPPIHDVTFKMEGAKIVGTDSAGDPIYKYSQNQTTDGVAEVNISDLEWDSYSFYVDKETTGLDLVEIESPPGTTTTQPIDLLPGENKEVRLILRAENSLLVTVLDTSTTNPIFGASVRLENSDLNYDEIQPTDEDGKTFFIPLESAIYNLEVQATGYASSTTSVSVSGDTTITVELTPSP